jgi:hypothetical protein
LTVTPDPPAPSGLSYSPLQPYYYLNRPVTALTPTVTGEVTSWQISSQLPSGLTFNTATGVISGTPTAASSTGDWVVTAGNPGGTTSVRLTFGVEIAPTFFYGSCSPQVELSTVQYTLGVAAQTLTPLIQGQCYSASVNGVEPWSITPALPAGLTFSNSTGIISGTPTALSAPTQYVITGGGPGGQTSAKLTIGVSSNVLLDLGHAAALQSIQFDTAHVLSEDAAGHWVLWNYATMAQIASGNTPASFNGPGGSLVLAPMTLAGSSVVIGTSSGLEVRSSSTGAVLAEIPVSQLSWWKLASDGSYVCAGTAQMLKCWSPSAKLLFSESGNYANALVFAAPSELLVALGGAAQNSIETVSTASWTSSVGPPFQGQFYAWFIDGRRFLTTAAGLGTVYVYSLATVLQDSRGLPSLEGLTGEGNWFWTNPGEVTIYAVGNSALPTATFAIGSPIPTGTFITSLNGTGPGALTVIDLSGAIPTTTSYSVPVVSSPPCVPSSCSAFAEISAYAWNSPLQFMLGTWHGLVLDASNSSAVRTFGYGEMTNIAGSTARAVFTTASGSAFSYESASNTLEHTVDLSSSEQIVLSPDGSVLAALDSGPGAGNETVNIYAMPSGTLINSFPFLSGAPSPLNITLSATGTTLGEVLSGPGTRQTVPTAGGTPTTYSISGNQPVQISPDSAHVALSNAPPPSSTTTLYTNGTAVATVPGWAVGWLPNDTLLVDPYGSPSGYQPVEIYAATGNLLATAPIPEINSFQAVTSDLLYSPQLNQVISLTSGSSIWASASLCGSPPNYDSFSCLDAFAGSVVVFVSTNLVLAQPY